jgi:hypothetical protein
MFLDKTTEAEFFTSLEKNLNTNYSFDKNLQDKRAADVEMYLKHAASALARAGLRKEAECVVMISSNVKDPATKDLTPEKMCDNLKEKGWVFNADDHDVDTCVAKDCAQCDVGKQPQLSQVELKKLRSMLK